MAVLLLKMLLDILPSFAILLPLTIAMIVTCGGDPKSDSEKRKSSRSSMSTSQDKNPRASSKSKSRETIRSNAKNTSKSKVGKNKSTSAPESVSHEKATPSQQNSAAKPQEDGKSSMIQTAPKEGAKSEQKDPVAAPGEEPKVEEEKPAEQEKKPEEEKPEKPEKPAEKTKKMEIKKEEAGKDIDIVAEVTPKAYPSIKEPTQSKKKRREEQLEKEKKEKIAEGFYQSKSDEDDTLENVKSLNQEMSMKSRRNGTSNRDKKADLARTKKSRVSEGLLINV